MSEINWTSNDFNNGQSSSGTNTGNISGTDNSLRQAYEHGSLTKGLIAYYPMEKGEGEILHDGALNNLGHIINGATWDSGNFGNSLSFDNSSDAVELNDSINIPQMEKATLSFWAAHTEKGQDNHATMYSESASGTNTDTYFCIQYENSDPKLDLHSNISGTYEKTSFEIPFDGSWHHYLVRKEGNNFKVFVDGNKVGDWNLNFPTGAEKTYIGERTPPDNYQPIVGKMHEVRVYNRALSQPEINALANKTKTSGVLKKEKQVPGKSEGGISRWKFDDSDTADAIDVWGDSIGIVSNANYTKSAVYGEALSFTGNGYVDVGNDNSLNVSGSQTLSAWVNMALADSSQWNIIAGKAESGNEQADLRTDNEDGSMIFLVRRNSDGEYFTADTGINSTEKWVFLVGVFDSSNEEIRVYANGKLKDKTDISDVELNQNNEPFQIGARSYDDGNEGYFEGKIDDVRIYNQALTAVQIEKLFHKSAYRISREDTLQ